MQLIKFYLVFINLLTFFLFVLDKWLAKKNRWRIPESRLLLCCIIGGAVGALLAMQIAHHKTQKITFIWGVPAILLAQVAIFAYSAWRLAGS